MPLNDKTKLTTQFRAQLTLPNLECTLTGKNLTNVQDAISVLLRSKARYEKAGDNSVFIYHQDHGTEPIGAINEMEVPEWMIVSKRTDQRFGIQRAA